MPVVSPTDPEPRFHVSLTDGTDILSFVLYDINNKRDPQAMRRFPIQQSALKTQQGGGRYDDLVFPYVAIAQDEFSSGYGVDDLDKNKSGYWDGMGVDTSRENGFFLAGLPQFGRGYRKMFHKWPSAEYSKLGWVNVNGADRYRAEKVVGDETFTPARLMFTYVMKGEVTGSFTVDIVADSSGDPTGASIIGGAETVYMDVDPYNQSTNVQKRQNKPETVSLSVNGSATILPGTTRWLKFDFGGLVGVDADNYIEFLALDGDATTTISVYSSDNSSWSTHSVNHQIACVILDDDDDWTAKWFDYKHNLYFVKSPTDGATAADLYMAGYRGAADSNAANKLRLYDATGPFTWTDDVPRAYQFEPVIAKITAGPGSQEERPWREVGNRVNANILQMMPGETWNVEHTIYSEYVIEGVHTFSLIDDGGSWIEYPVTDVEVVNDMVFMAQGARRPIVQYRAYNNGGVWSDEWAQACKKGGEFLQVQHDYKLGKLMWIGRNPITANNYRTHVLRDTAPATWDAGLQLYGGVLAENDVEWDEYQNPNGTFTFNSGNQQKVVLADGFTAPGILWTTETEDTNLTRMTHLRLVVKTSEALAAGELQFLIDDTAQCASPILTVNAPALDKEKWTPLFLDVDTNDVDVSAIQSFGVQLTVDKGANHTIEVAYDVEWHVDDEPIEVGKFGSGNLTGMEVYDDPERLYVFTTGELGYISGNKYQAVPLREMRHLESSYNGRAHAVGGVYLYFGLGADGRVQQYFRQTLNDIGPTRDDGMREDRRGPIASLVAYPGDRVYAAIDGGQAGYSSIQLHSKGGWHELFRAFQPGQVISSLWVQPIEGQTTQKLWFCLDGIIMWIPIAFNAMDERTFPFTYHGQLTTGWVYMNMHDLNKVFRNIKVWMEDFSKTSTSLGSGGTFNQGAWLRLSYQKDNGTGLTASDRDGSLLKVTGFDDGGDYVPGGSEWIISTDPWTFQEEVYDAIVADIDLGTSAPYGLTCRRIQFKFDIFNTDVIRSPKVVAWVAKGYAVQDVKHGYAMSTKLTEGDLSIDLEGDEVKSANYAQTVELAMAKLDSWASTVTPLTLNSIYSPFDSKTVVLNSIPMQPIRSIPDDQVEEQLLQLTVEEL